MKEALLRLSGRVNGIPAQMTVTGAPGYVPAAQWETAYYAQRARLWEFKDLFEITIALTPE